jgi:hypothetical protein
MHHMRMSHRIRYAAALAAVGLVTSAGTASAHHCYKDQWADAAYQHHLNGGTAWVSLSDLGAMFLIPEELQAECGWVADAAVADWMEMNDMTQEPLIHSKATIGSGAFYKKGMAPKPFSYLSDAQFEELGGMLFGYLAECAGPMD